MLQPVDALRQEVADLHERVDFAERMLDEMVRLRDRGVGGPDARNPAQDMAAARFRERIQVR